MRVSAMGSTWGALGTHKDEKQRLTLEDVGRRFRRSDAVSGTYPQVSKTPESDVVILTD